MIHTLGAFILGVAIVLGFYAIWLIIEDALKGKNRGGE
jgi:hypothetical protein